jgi:pantothenate kinase
VFDRDLEISRGSARIIPDDVKLILVEGNYVLLDRAPWDALDEMFDLTVMIDVPEEELRRRLRARWEHFGLTEDQIAHKLDGNDLPNGRDVIQGSRPADIIYRQDEGSL